VRSKWFFEDEIQADSNFSKFRGDKRSHFNVGLVQALVDLDVLGAHAPVEKIKSSTLPYVLHLQTRVTLHVR
jgi:hypothetical protein